MTSRRAPLEDIPPPPYSETDIYSNTSSGPSPTNPTPPTTTSTLRRNSSNSDDTSTTYDGEIIYTPPLTPQSAQSNTAADLVAAPSSPVATSRPRRIPEAQAYFDSRPHSGIFVGGPTTVEITLAADPALTDVEAIAGIDRLTVDGGAGENGDITREDWMTFLNYLLPGFADRTNERVVDRKLRAEGVETGSEKGESDTRSQAEVFLLERIRGVGNRDGDGEGVGARRERVERMVREWNEGFWERRGVRVVVSYEGEGEREERMPGGWEERFDTPSGQEQTPARQGQRQARGQGGWMGRFSPFGGGSGAAGPSNSNNNNNGNGFNFGGIKVDGERISIGNNFVVDGRTGHLKIGGIVADTNGISINGWNPGNMFGGRGGPHGRGGGSGGWCRPPGDARGFQPPPIMPGMSCPPRWTWGGPGGRGACGGQRPERGQHHYFGRGGRGGWWNSRWGQGPTEPEQPAQRGREGEEGVGNVQPANQPAQGQDRGRTHQSPSKQRRRSRSSSVSSTSRSSSSSESTIGSLPDYDDLKDTQLPVMKTYLSESLHHPEQQITRERVRQAKQQIREARRAPATEINEPVNMTQDRKALRREVKELMREWKQLKKEQKRQRRQLRKEKRQRRRQEKREKRQTKKEMRRAEKDFHRHGHRSGPLPAPHHGPPPPGPPPPHGPSHLFPQGFPPYMPPMSPVPPMPPMPQTHPFGAPALPLVSQSEAPPSYRGLSFDAAANSPPTPTGFPLGRPGPLPPGAWPQESDNATPPEPSAAKYKRADEIEDEITAKYSDLLSLQEKISGPGFPKAEDEKAAIGLEKEIEELAVEMERLRTEADEEFARELAREEESRHGLFMRAER
ncbi:Putative protein of unknown function [Podospora comata]|uniref:Uncharacterized protein n=1 Tax=Podospora comata TaxID=48703 RepID=A0ABY6S4F7_PODCO|nr:Putative protein of unknown function [Podospora comata]